MKNANDNTLQSETYRQQGESVANTLKKAGQMVKEEACDKFEQTMYDVKKKSSEIQEAVSEYVKEKPIQSLGWAVLSGVILGFVLRK